MTDTGCFPDAAIQTYFLLVSYFKPSFVFWPELTAISVSSCALRDGGLLFVNGFDAYSGTDIGRRCKRACGQKLRPSSIIIQGFVGILPDLIRPGEAVLNLSYSAVSDALLVIPFWLFDFRITAAKSGT